MVQNVSSPSTDVRLRCACRERKFVLSYFLADDTLSIFEPPQRNTGITGGKYLERSKVLNVFQNFLVVALC